MTFKIEAGKFYRTRDGRKVGPMDGPSFYGAFYFPMRHDGEISCWPNGKIRFDKTPCDGDLVAEWTDEPETTPAPAPAPAPEAAPEPASPAKRFKVTVVWDAGDGPQEDTFVDVTAYYINDGFLRVEQADDSAHMFALQHVRVYSVTGRNPA